MFSHELLNALPRFDWLDPVMVLASRFGEEWFFTLVLPLVVFLGYFRFAAIAGLSFFLTTYLNQVLKVLGDFSRPEVAKLTFAAQDLYLRYPEISNGLPSGHSQIAMSFFLLSAILVKRGFFFWAALILAVLVPLSRLYLGVHFLADVIAGSAIGLIIMVYSLRRGLDLVDTLSRQTRSLFVPLAGLVLLFCFIFDTKMAWVTGGSLLGFTMGITRLHSQFDVSALHIRENNGLKAAAAIILTLLVLLAARSLLKLAFPALHFFDFLRYFILLYLVSYTAPVFLHRFVQYQLKVVHSMAPR